MLWALAYGSAFSFQSLLEYYIDLDRALVYALRSVHGGSSWGCRAWTMQSLVYKCMQPACAPHRPWQPQLPVPLPCDGGQFWGYHIKEAAAGYRNVHAS